MSPRRIRQIVVKEFIQLRRDPRLLRLLILMPLVQLVIFGYAVTFDVRDVPVLVYDQDWSPASRELVRRFTNTQYFTLAGYADRPQQINRALDSGRAQVALSFPEDFSRLLARVRTAPLQVVVDGSDPGTTRVVLGYISAIVRGYSEQVVMARLARLGPGLVEAVPMVQGDLRTWYNPDLRSVNFMVPGVLAMILLVVTMSMTSLAVVREREVGTLEQLVVTPIRPGELLLGKMIPFVIIGLADVVLIVAVAHFWFLVPLEGSLLLLLLFTLLFVACGLGLGLFVSTVSHTQQQAVMTTFFIMMPSILLSGFMFPIANMPRVIQALTYFIPLRYYLVIVRGIFLKGNGWAVLWPQALALALLAAAILALAITRFHKRLD